MQQKGKWANQNLCSSPYLAFWLMLLCQSKFSRRIEPIQVHTQIYTYTQTDIGKDGHRHAQINRHTHNIHIDRQTWTYTQSHRQTQTQKDVDMTQTLLNQLTLSGNASVSRAENLGWFLVLEAQWLSLEQSHSALSLESQQPGTFSPGGLQPQQSPSGAENLGGSWRAVCPQSAMRLETLE